MKKKLELNQEQLKRAIELAKNNEEKMAQRSEAELDIMEQEVSDRVNNLMQKSHADAHTNVDKNLESEMSRNWSAIQSKISKNESQAENNTENIVRIADFSRKKRSNTMVWGSLLTIAACAALYVMNREDISQPLDPIYKGGDVSDFSCDLELRTPEGVGIFDPDGISISVPQNQIISLAGACSAEAQLHYIVVSPAGEMASINLNVSDQKAIIKDTLASSTINSGKIIIYVTQAPLESDASIPSTAFIDEIGSQKVLWSDELNFTRAE
jgi:ElaB/YqjD/DUF883 family membrane-anchored ribosome-binding protein